MFNCHVKHRKHFLKHYQDLRLKYIKPPAPSCWSGQMNSTSYLLRLQAGLLQEQGRGSVLGWVFWQGDGYLTLGSQQNRTHPSSQRTHQRKPEAYIQAHTSKTAPSCTLYIHLRSLLHQNHQQTFDELGYTQVATTDKPWQGDQSVLARVSVPGDSWKVETWNQCRCESIALFLMEYVCKARSRSQVFHNLNNNNDEEYDHYYLRTYSGNRF